MILLSPLNEHSRVILANPPYQHDAIHKGGINFKWSIIPLRHAQITALRMPPCQRIILCIARGRKNLGCKPARTRNSGQVFKIHIGFLQIAPSTSTSTCHRNDVIAEFRQIKPAVRQSRFHRISRRWGRSSPPRDRKLSCRRPPRRNSSFKRWQPFNSFPPPPASYCRNVRSSCCHPGPRCLFFCASSLFTFYRLCSSSSLLPPRFAPFSSSSRRCRSSLIVTQFLVSDPPDGQPQCPDSRPGNRGKPNMTPQ